MAKVIFLHLSVILFTGGVCLSECWDTTPPPGADISPGADTPWEQTQPQSRHPPGSKLRHTVNEWPSRHPPQSRHTPPREADSGIRSMSGRYASYWNIFLRLFFLKFEHFVLLLSPANEVCEGYVFTVCLSTGGSASGGQ